jgi:UDP-N-acetylmuramate dehydrogenase
VSNRDVALAEALLRAACADRLRTRFPLAPLTTFRVGGPAALFLEVETEEDLRAVSAAVAEYGVPVAVIGKGSNILVSDRGFNGLVLRLGRSFRWAARDGERISAGAAMPLPALAGVALWHRLEGFEFAVAIPASFGGAVRMNAGAHGGSMSEVLERIDVFSLREGSAQSLLAADAEFSYRRSGLSADAVVVAGVLRLGSGDPARIRERMDEARDWRRATQPLAEPNCGSVFTNPPDDHAGRLIEAAGLKGYRIGGAEVSDKHANFIVASGASAQDIVDLINHVRAVVGDSFGVRLEPEVRLLGEFDDARI